VNKFKNDKIKKETRKENLLKYVNGLLSLLLWEEFS
jgi:hypothetical protein